VNLFLEAATLGFGKDVDEKTGRLRDQQAVIVPFLLFLLEELHKFRFQLEIETDPLTLVDALELLIELLG